VLPVPDEPEAPLEAPEVASSPPRGGAVADPEQAAAMRVSEMAERRTALLIVTTS
jgi:hypothetical protein